MKKLLLAMLVLLPAIAFAGGHGQFRDGSGNLTGTWRQQGNRVEIRDSSGNLTREVSPFNSSSRDHFNVRDGSGNLVGEINRDRND